MKRFTIYFYAFAVSFITVLSSCSSSDEGEVNLRENTSRFINGNGNIVLFGKVDLKQLVDKANLDNKKYAQVSIVTEEMGNIQKALNLETPIYFAFEGPLRNDGSPEVAYLLMEAKSDTALLNELQRRGFLIEKAGDLSYTEDGDFAIGVRDKLAIAIIKRGQSEATMDLKKAYKLLKSDESGGKTDEILAQQGDIVLGTSIEKLYKTSSTDLSKLEAGKQVELKEMVTDSYVQTTFRFEPGQAVIESKNLFSEKLMEVMPFKTDESGKLLNKINKGAGTPVAGLAVNVDVTKMEAFMNNYSPETIAMIFRTFGFGGNLFGGLPIAAMATNGQGIGLFTADLDNNAMHFNFFVNASKLGRDMTEEQFKKSKMSKYIKLRSDAEGLRGSFVFGDTMNYEPQTIEFPDACRNFGKKGITFFLYLNDIDVEDFGMFGPMELMEDVQYVLFEADNDGVTLTVKSKKEDVNFLESSTNVALDFLSNEVQLLNM